MFVEGGKEMQGFVVGFGQQTFSSIAFYHHLYVSA